MPRQLYGLAIVRIATVDRQNASNSAGRVSASQAECRGFESRLPLHLPARAQHAPSLRTVPSPLDARDGDRRVTIGAGLPVLVVFELPGSGRPDAPDCKNGPVDDELGTTLTIDDLVLRPWRPADAPEVFAVCQDPEIARWVTIPQPFGPADAEAFIETARAMWRDGTGAAFAIVDAATDRLLGAVTRFGPDGHQATFGLWLAPEARGRGVGARSLRLVADWTFDTTAAIRLDAFIMVGNEASNRMVERAGFRREGVARAWDLHHDGVPVDCTVFSRIRGDG